MSRGPSVRGTGMAALKKFAAGVSAVSLAVGASVFGAGAATAQGSLEMVGELPDTIADLQLAAQALNGPVSVVGNAEGGPTVTYTNETDIIQRCSGFTMPYSTVKENDIDPNALADASFSEMSELAQLITAEGGVAILRTVDGEPDSFDSGAYDIIFTLNDLITKDDEKNTGALLAPGEDATWVATAPESPSAAAIMCVTEPERSLSGVEYFFGVDKQVVADQVNDKLGPLGSVGAGSVTGGSVELGATALAPLGELNMGSITDSADGGDVEDPGEGGVEQPE